MGEIRRCGERDHARIAEIINDAGLVYRGAIPAECWHQPYMSRAQLRSDIHAGVEFWGYEADGRLVGVMGMQQVRDVDLIRHAYVVSSAQRGGVGAQLLRHLVSSSRRQVWVGTWAAAGWAIRFYERYGFEMTDAAETQRLLGSYWSIPANQAAASVVLGKSAHL